MAVWAWILAYVVGFSLLQLLVYRYVRDSDPSVEGPSVGDQYLTTADRPERGGGQGEHDDASVYCQHCGARNELGAPFRYCRECTAPLR